jgi:uncharacterized protein (DUF58 family)
MKLDEILGGLKRIRSSGRRVLEVSASGKGFLALTIVLGTSAVVSGNNLLYLMECLLLGSLIVSGIFSEFSISALEVVQWNSPATAGERSRDTLWIRNRSLLPVYSVTVAVRVHGSATEQAYVDRIEGRGEVRIPSDELFRTRGELVADARLISTRSPFGFARKTRIIPEWFERTVWPDYQPGTRNSGRGADEGGASADRGGLNRIIEGEVRQISPGEDARAIVWILSTKGETVGRRVAPTRDGLRVLIDLRETKKARFEKKVIEAAEPFHRLIRNRRHSREEERDAELHVISSLGIRKIRGAVESLDFLAKASPELPPDASTPGSLA